MTAKKHMRVQDYIEHIIEAITRIEGYVKGLDRESFVENSIVQDAVVRNIEIIGEAANNITAADSTFAQRHLHLRLEEACRMRNALAHGYYSVNLLTVWNTVQNDLPILKKQMTDIQNASMPPPDSE
ncbi:MAG: DUF86 domain-containing protein [Beijerinckiaceae bacterium]